MVKEKLNAAFRAIIDFIVKHKITSAAILSAVAAIVAASIVITSILSAPTSTDEVFSSNSNFSSQVESTTSDLTVSEPEPEPESVVSPAPSQVQKPTPSVVTPPPAPKPPVNTAFVPNTNTDPDNNVFLDAMVYTGYNINKHRSDGLMWVYILASQKRAKGWLSNIGYGGGCSGYEVNEHGLPNIARFERGGLVCASYVTYVYFNYLPNIAGINTSALQRPERSYDANCWYIAAQQWVQSGFSQKINFTASSQGGFIKFNAERDIPIGSIICLTDFYNRNNHCTHVCLYAGYKNGYHWVTHVGNDNGPEFCAIERMSCGPDPQWPLAVITTPSNIRFAAALDVAVKDEKGSPLSGVSLSLKNLKTSVTTPLGTTNASGIISKEGLSYGEYQIIQSVPEGYTCANPTVSINLTTQNNSKTTYTFTDTKIPEPKVEDKSKPEDDQKDENSDGPTLTE